MEKLEKSKGKRNAPLKDIKVLQIFLQQALVTIIM
jgi:hypothetical protein